MANLSDEGMRGRKVTIEQSNQCGELKTEEVRRRSSGKQTNRFYEAFQQARLATANYTSAGESSVVGGVS